MQRSDFKNIKNRRSGEAKIFTDEEFGIQNNPEGPVAKQDAVRSTLSNELKAFALQNFERIRNKVTNNYQEIEKSPSLGEPKMMGNIQVIPLLPGSSKGGKRPNSPKSRLEFQTAKEIIKDFQRQSVSLKKIQPKRQQRLLENREILNKFGKTPFDTGSTAVQIALQTQRIENLKKHFLVHKKDKHSKRGFIQLIQKRKALLKYLKDNQEEEYEKTRLALGLRR